jgi:type II secretory pathway pseudopilin PulG
MKIHRTLSEKKGFVLINTLVFAVIAIVVTTSLVGWAGSVLKASRQLAVREQAIQLAEAGIDYYRWHLAHAQNDYYDGQGATSTGPYVHDVTDKLGNVIGQYSLVITPPGAGSTAVKIQSTGSPVSDPSVQRTIQSVLAIPSFTRYAVLSNDAVRFGQGTEVFGPIHANGGIRFDGLAHNLVTSAVDKYNDLDEPGGFVFGVYTMSSPADPDPPSAVPDRPDVFMVGRTFPVPVVDFDILTANLSQIKTDAQAAGRYFASSGSQGYHIVLKTNDTFDLYRVTAVEPGEKNCGNSQSQNGWSTWSIKTEELLSNYTFPTNGLIFVEDHVWVDGAIDGARLTIAAGRFPDSPGQRRNVIVNNNLTYTHYDGTDVLGLIAQGDFNVGLYSADDLRIDAAIIAQNGRIGRYYHNGNCGPTAMRDSITLYGMIASNGRYGFAYTDGNGYATRNITYDGNLLYAPPPSFPLASTQYQTVSWTEVK